MRYHCLGKTGVLVSELSFGMGTKAGSEDIGPKVRVCLDAGINLFDTSNVYLNGEAEILLAEALGNRRKDILLSTKCSLRTGAGPNEIGSSSLNIIRACENSLRKLNTDWIDLYQLHALDALTAPEETLRAMDILIKAGKIRYIGCSNFSGWQVMRYLATSAERHLTQFTFQQIYYSLVGRDSERELIPLSLDQKLANLIWGPLASGFLAGKIKRGGPIPPGTNLSKNARTDIIPDWNIGHDIVDVARAIGVERNVSVGQVAINWLLRKAGVSTVILGARTLLQLEENINAGSFVLSKGEVDRLDEVSKPNLTYPYWHHEVTMPERNAICSSYRE